MAVAREAGWLGRFAASTSSELELCENELIFGVGGVSIGGSSFALLLFDEVSPMMEEI